MPEYYYNGTWTVSTTFTGQYTVANPAINFVHYPVDPTPKLTPVKEEYFATLITKEDEDA